METHSLVLQTFLAAEPSSAHFMHYALKACTKVVSINLCSLHRSSVAQSMTVRDVLSSCTRMHLLSFSATAQSRAVCHLPSQSRFTPISVLRSRRATSFIPAQSNAPSGGTKRPRQPWYEQNSSMKAVLAFEELFVQMVVVVLEDIKAGLSVSAAFCRFQVGSSA